MAKTEETVKRALGGHKTSGKKGSGTKLHTHAVRYERADNGGLHATVERHTAAGHHHTEHHVLADPDAAKEHMEEHMGDQPAVGQMQPAQQAPPPPGEEAEGGQPAGPMQQAGM